MRASALFLIASLAASAQTTRTAASSALSDVQTTVNASSNGDTVQIPCSPSSSTWSGSLTVPVNITITGLGATPNSGPSTFGAGTNCLTITQNASEVIQLSPTYSSSNNVTTLQNITIVPGGTPANNCWPIAVSGTGTSSGMPLVRIDNIIFGTTGNPYTQTCSAANFAMLWNNAFGVIDHNTLPNNSQVEYASINLTSYLGVGLYGDNSWAQPDTFGSSNNVYLENNLLNQGGWPVVENESLFPNIGGGRAVTRFNQVTASNGGVGGWFFLTGGHGLDTDGRDRSMRHNETYGNQITCSAGTTCYSLCSYRGGTGLCWGNTVTNGSGAQLKNIAGLSTYRAIGDTILGGTNIGSCGNALSGQSQGPFDINDGTTVYDSGTATSGSSGNTLNDSTKSWTSSQWSNPSDNYPCSVWNTTSGKQWVVSIATNGTNTLNMFPCNHGLIGGSGCSTFNFSPGDTYEIVRSKGCTDGASFGQGQLLQNFAAVLVSTGNPGPINQALDPIYEWDNTTPSLTGGGNIQGAGPNSVTPYAAANRNYYTDNSGGSPTANTSPTSPFNGSSGVGFGVVANRPTTCTAGVAYEATDVGSWNSSGNGFGQGTLYKCTSTNTWTSSYVPYPYPHPLASGGGGGGVSLTVSTSGSGGGSISGTNCTTGSYTSGTAIGPCTATPSGGSTFTGWSSTGSASCSGTGTCPSSGSFSLTATTTITAAFSGGTPTCGNPFQSGPNYSGTYTVPPTTLPLAIGFTSPTAGCTMVMTLDGTIPSSTCTIGGSTQAYAAQNISVTTVMIVRACQSGYTPSSNVGGTWTIVNTNPSIGVSFSGSVKLNGSIGVQ